MLIEKLSMERIPESHNKIKKSGTTFGVKFPQRTKIILFSHPTTHFLTTNSINFTNKLVLFFY